tara:strand:- start:1419 stop:2579 length:1161 start_codon:yes stop_codon:yes gene_type:complete
MYKIFKNEIKISQFLKGGSLTKIDEQAYKDDKLNFDADIDFNLVKPFRGTTIDFHDFNEEMLNAIFETLKLFNDEFKLLNIDEKFEINRKEFEEVIKEEKKKLKEEENEKEKNILEEKLNSTIEGAKEYEEKIKILLKVAIGNLKELGLFDHYTNKFIDFDTFVNNLISKENIDKKSNDDAVENFIIMLKDKNEEKDEEELTLRVFYDITKMLYKLFQIDSSKIYFRQTLDEPKYFSVNRRFMQGGNYDQLQYMLNGGSINTIVRIPNLSSYFKSQLKFIDNKLRINNKKLSENSRRDINQIIDGLEKHENNLKDKFELLKSAYLIDRDIINMQDEEQKRLMAEAKKSLGKHKRYVGAFGDLIDTLEKIANKKDEVKKPLDKYFLS